MLYSRSLLAVHLNYNSYSVPDTVLGVEQPYSGGGENYTIPAVTGCTEFSHPLPQIHVNQEHQNITLFGNRVFADVDS